MAMHGDVLLDADRIAATLTAMVEPARSTR